MLLALTVAAAHAPARAIDGHNVGTRLDLRYVEAGRPTQPLRIRVGMWRAWNSQILTKSSAIILFDVDWDGGQDYAGRIAWTGHNLALSIEGGGSNFESPSLCDDRTRRGWKLSSQVTRP